MLTSLIENGGSKMKPRGWRLPAFGGARCVARYQRPKAPHHQDDTRNSLEVDYTNEVRPLTAGLAVAGKVSPIPIGYTGPKRPWIIAKSPAKKAGRRNWQVVTNRLFSQNDSMQWQEGHAPSSKTIWSDWFKCSHSLVTLARSRVCACSAMQSNDHLGQTDLRSESVAAGTATGVTLVQTRPSG